MPTSKNRKLLLIACSKRKVRTKGRLPAIERYDGGTFRVIHKAQREGYFPKNVDILILSAKFGLIDASKRIPYYDQRMDTKRAQELSILVRQALQKQFAKQDYAEIYIDMGADYLPSIGELVVPRNTELVLAKGKIGVRLGNLKKWLSSKKGLMDGER